MRCFEKSQYLWNEGRERMVKKSSKIWWDWDKHDLLETKRCEFFYKKASEVARILRWLTSNDPWSSIIPFPWVQAGPENMMEYYCCDYVIWQMWSDSAYVIKVPNQLILCLPKEIVLGEPDLIRWTLKRGFRPSLNSERQSSILSLFCHFWKGEESYCELPVERSSLPTKGREWILSRTWMSLEEDPELDMRM